MFPEEWCQFVYSVLGEISSYIIHEITEIFLFAILRQTCTKSKKGNYSTPRDFTRAEKYFSKLDFKGKM